MKIGSHVSMSGKEMLLGSAKEAKLYGANVFMVYTGAPQNTKRKDIKDLNIDMAWDYMKKNDMEEIVVHAPYIINLGNAINPATFEIATQFLSLEIERTSAMKGKVLVLHPGSHVKEGDDVGIKQIIKGLNEVMTREMQVNIALELMSGKGSEIGRNFEQLARIYDGVIFSDKLRVCFDTCHVHDSGYDIINDFDGVIAKFHSMIGKDQIAVFHINDSKNVSGARKDRHENVGFGNIGFEALHYIVHHKEFTQISKILETPYIPDESNKNKSYPPYKYEIEMLKKGVFNPNMKHDILKNVIQE